MKITIDGWDIVWMLGIVGVFVMFWVQHNSEQINIQTCLQKDKQFDSTTKACK